MKLIHNKNGKVSKLKLVGWILLFGALVGAFGNSHSDSSAQDKAAKASVKAKATVDNPANVKMGALLGGTVSEFKKEYGKPTTDDGHIATFQDGYITGMYTKNIINNIDVNFNPIEKKDNALKQAKAFIPLDSKFIKVVTIKAQNGNPASIAYLYSSDSLKKAIPDKDWYAGVKVGEFSIVLLQDLYSKGYTQATISLGEPTN
jgi:hypothetical protein